MEHSMNYGLSFDDVLIVPSYSELDSRDEIDLGVDLGFVHLDIPIMTSPMDSVTGIEMMDAIRRLGGIGIHHRYVDTDLLVRAYHHGGIAVSPSMGLDWTNKISDEDRAYGVLVVDVAHGHTKKVIDYAAELINQGFNVMSGNIVTGHAAEEYLRAGVNLLRVGVGEGAACSTRIVSGVGVPQFSAILEVSSACGDDAYVIADGGIRYGGDIVKALVAGASCVMVGRLVAGATEAPGLTEMVNGRWMKMFRGMASASALDEAGKERNVEGVSAMIPHEGTVAEILDQVIRGVRAGFGYVGAKNINELWAYAQFIQVSPLSIQESHPRI